MKNNRGREGGREGVRKEGGSFLLFKVRLRVIHKKKENRKKMRDFRVRNSHFSLDFPTIGP